MATIKGITIEISGKSDGLVKSLKTADAALKNTNDALKAVNKALELDPTNVELLAQKEQLLSNAVKETSDRLNVLKEAAELARQGMEEGTATREQYAQLTAEIATTEHSLEELTSTADGAGDSLEDVGDSALEAGDNALEAGDKAENAGEGWNTFAAMAQGAAQAITTYVLDALKSASEALVDFTKQAVQSYGDFEQLEGGIEKLFGDDAAKIVQENAANAFATVGISANEYMETVTSFSASLISSLGGDTEAAAELADVALQDMADNANTFGRSVDDIMTVYSGLARGVYSTLDNLSLGFAGTKEGMLDLVNASGIFANEIESLDDVSYADMIRAIHAVQQQMNITGTTANEAMRTVQGSINMTSAAWSNLVTGMGNSEADIGELITNFVESASAAAHNIGPVIETVFENLVVLVEEIGPYLEELLPEMVGSTFGAIVEALSALIVAIVNQLPSMLVILTSAIPELLDTLIPAILLVLPKILEAGLTIVEALAMSLATNAPVLIPMVIQVCNEIISTILSHLDEIAIAGVELLLGLALGIVSAIPDMLAFFPQVFNAIGNTLRDFATGLIDAASTWGVDMIDNFISGITSGFSRLTSAVSQAAELVASYLHFSVPKKGALSDFDESGGDMIDVFAKGMRDELGTLESTLSLTGNTIANGMQQAIDYSSQLNGIATGVTNLGAVTPHFTIMIGNEELDNYIVMAGNTNDFRAGGH